MKDMDPGHQVQQVLEAWASGRPGAIEEVLHRDFVAYGVEAGLYIQSDRATFLRASAVMARLQDALPARIDWIDIRDRIATGCLVSTEPQARRTTLLTLMRGDAGWQVITATFTVEEGPDLRSAPRVTLQ